MFLNVKITPLYIGFGLAVVATAIYMFQYQTDHLLEEDKRIPIVHLHRLSTPADFELNIQTNLKPPSPHKGELEGDNLLASDEIEAFILAEDPEYIYSSKEVDKPAVPKQDLQTICRQIAKEKKLIPCKNMVMRMELIVHREGILIDWRTQPIDHPVCESILLAFISHIKHWEPAIEQGEAVTQLVKIHIHFN